MVTKRRVDTGIPAFKEFILLMRVTKASLVAQRIKCLPAMREILVQSLGWESPLEKEMTTHFSILAWRIPWTEEPGGLQLTESQRVGHDGATSLHFTKTNMQMLKKLKNSNSYHEEKNPVTEPKTTGLVKRT